ncbi:MAG: DUF1344 domain-containing protein [Devosia sp.]
MRKLAIALMLLSALAASSAALAASPMETKGVIKSFDPIACTVTLEVSDTYHFAPKCNFSKLKVGEKVAITWTRKGAEMNATKIVKSA